LPARCALLKALFNFTRCAAAPLLLLLLAVSVYLACIGRRLDSAA